MKILVTGMASSHCKKPSSTTFFALLAGGLEEFGEVIWATPKLSWSKKDLEEFDLVIFGLIPPTALSANRIYGAMHVLGILFDSPKLRIVVDSPQIWQYKNSIEAVKRDVSTLFSDFYAKRYDYRRAQSEEGRKYIELAARRMGDEQWPTVIYPELPWTKKESVTSVLSIVPSAALVGLNLDPFVLIPEPVSGTDRSNYWSVDGTKSLWYAKLQPSLRYGGVEARPSKHITQSESHRIIRSSFGLIVPPQERNTGTWWSYRYIQGLVSNTPIVTLWSESATMGQAWSYLAYQIEDMTAYQRQSVAREQLESYLLAVGNKGAVLDKIKTNVINSTKERV